MYYPVPYVSYEALINPSNREMIARIIRIWISPEALYTKNPSIQPITRMTAIRYSMLLMLMMFTGTHKNIKPFSALDTGPPNV